MLILTYMYYTPLPVMLRNLHFPKEAMVGRYL